MIIMKRALKNGAKNRGVTKKNIIQTIKEKEMDRKDFLKYSGVVLIGIVGLKGIISMLTVPPEHSSVGIVEKNESRGFGSGKYGS